MTEVSENEVTCLAVAARGGDRAAFDRLVRRFHKPLVGFFRALMPGNIADPEALAQDTWIAVWKSISTPASEGGFDPAKGTFFSFVKYRYGTYMLRRELSAQAKQAKRECSISKLTEGGSDALLFKERLWVDPVRLLQKGEQLRLRLAAFGELFRLIFLCGGYPHQQLALAFVTYVYGHCGNRVQMVDERHGTTRLEALAGELQELFGAALKAAAPEKDRQPSQLLQPLHDRMELTVEHLMRNDGASLKCFGPDSQKVVGHTCLHDYYAGRKGGFTAAIPDWCYKVEQRVRSILRVQGLASRDKMSARAASPAASAAPPPIVCSRCKLRHAPPCA